LTAFVAPLTAFVDFALGGPVDCCPVDCCPVDCCPKL
jgi:hypothetical protein